MKIAVLDIETTGFGKSAKILEIGIVELNLANGKIKTLYNELVRETGICELYAESWIFKNSNLHLEDVLGAKPLDFKTIQKILDKYLTTAFNKPFDFRFLKSRGFKIKELACIMLLAKPVCKIKLKSGSYKNPKVQEAWDIIVGTDYVEKHRGCDDAKHEAEILYRMYVENDNVKELLWEVENDKN